MFCWLELALAAIVVGTMPKVVTAPPTSTKPCDWDGRGYASDDDGSTEAPDSGDECEVDFPDDLREQRRQDNEYYNTVGPEKAGAEFCDLLVEMKRSSQRMTAQHACMLAFWAARANISGPASKLALKPQRQSGKYSVKFDSFTGIEVTPTDGSIYYLRNVSTFSRRQASKTSSSIATLPGHESLANELHGDPALLRKLEVAKFNGDLPDVYHSHPVVQQHAHDGVPVWPLAIYVDGIQVQDRETVIAFYIYSVISGVRHCMATLKKFELCRCGCRGYCTIVCMWAMIHWTLVALSLDRYPSSRHDPLAWDIFDNVREALAGATMGFAGALLYLKCDMAEWPKSLFSLLTIRTSTVARYAGHPSTGYMTLRVGTCCLGAPAR